MFRIAMDVTNRKPTAFSSEESEAHFLTLIQHSSDIITILDLDGAIKFESPSFERLLGYSHHELDGLIAFEFLHPDDLPTVIERFQLIVERPGEAQTAEFRFRHKDGSWLRLEGIGRSILDTEGRPFVIVNSRDITERQRTETLLRSSQEKLQQALQASNTGLWDWNTETNEVAFSREWKLQLGYEEDELLSVFETWQTRLHPDDRTRAMAYVWSYLADPQGLYQQEFRLRHKDGSYRWIESRASFVTEPDGRRVRLLGSHMDITARKLMEEALRVSQGRYARATAVGKIGVWELDVATGTYHSDVNLKALFGYEEDELSTDPYVWLNLVHPDDQAIAMQSWQRIVTGEIDHYNYELRMVKKDGMVIWTDVRGHAVRNSEGQVTQLFGATVDVTERKRTEQALGEREEALARFKATLDQVHDCVFMFAADSLKFVYCNRGAVAQVGYTEDELATMTPLDIKPEFTERTFREMLQPLRDGSRTVQVFETVHRHKDGHDVAVEVSMQFVAEARQAGRFVAVVRDIAERKQAQETLRLSEERFRSLFENTPVAYQSLDHTGRFIDVNQQLCHLLGYEREELIGSEFGEFWADDVRGYFPETFEDFKKTGRVRNELALRRRDGAIVNAVIDGRIQRDQNGEFLRTHCILTDITERTRAEEALRRREAGLKEAQRIAHIGSWELDLVTKRLTWSDEVYRIFEIDSEFFGASYEAFLQLVHPDDRSSVNQAYTESVMARTPYNISYRLLMPDGRIKFVRERCETKYGSDGLPIGSTGTVQDITEQMRATEALQRSEERFSKAFNEAAIGMALVALDGRWLQVNRALCNIVGYSKEELEATTFQAVTHPDDLESDLTLLRQLLEGEISTYRMEKRYLHKQGHIVWIVLSVSLVRQSNGEPQHLISQMQDITEQKKAEEALAHNHALLTAIMDASIDLIYIKDLQGRYVHINRAGAEAVGLSAEAVIGWDDVALWGGESAASRRHSDRLVAASGNPIMVEERGTVLGNIAEFLTTKVPYCDPEGRIIGVIGIARNITEWKRVEEERRKALMLLTNVINASPDMIFVKDRDLRTILCNNSFAQAIGKTPEDMIGRSDIENGWDPDLVRGNPDAGIRGYELDDLEALTGTVVHNPSDLVNVKGEVRIFDTYKVPLRGETGAVTSILGVARDITERKRMEEILSQRERDLRVAVKERERISEDLHDGILQSIFAVGLGLESCRTLISELPLPSKKATAPVMAALDRAIGQLNHVMSEVRNFIVGIESHVLQGGDVASTLRTMVHAMCASNGTTCRVTIEKAAVRELSTEQAYHVVNIVREALGNSLRHSGSVRITLSFKRLRRSVRLSVTDNGKGFIPDRVRDVGHGMANMAARARKLGGRIEVHSRPRQGTKVLFDMPRRSAADA
jgi:PAS domain S-box-containing protein